MSDNNSNDKRCFSCGRTEKEAGKLICLTDSMCAVTVSNP